MKPFEENFTAWIDGELAGAELAAFDAELAKVQDAEAEKAGAHQLGDLLRLHGNAPELKNADFFNHQLLQAIELEQRRETAPVRTAVSWWTLPRIAWVGAASLLVALALGQMLIPRGPIENPTGGDYVAQVIESSTDDPAISATSFHSKKENVTVLWLDGLDYVPENYKLK